MPNGTQRICVYANMRSLILAVMLSLFLPLSATPQTMSQRKAPTPAGPHGSIPMPADRADDSYAIYSQLMPGDSFSRMAPELNEHWAIAEITVNENDRNPAIAPQTQLKPPPENPRGFEEAVADYEANKSVRIQLTKPPFHLDHDFSLLSPDQVASMRTARWPGYPGITFFSAVYFDAKHRAALVYMNDWCAHLCAAGTWVYLEKQGDDWVRRSGVVVPGA